MQVSRTNRWKHIRNNLKFWPSWLEIGTKILLLTVTIILINLTAELHHKDVQEVLNADTKAEKKLHPQVIIILRTEGYNKALEIHNGRPDIIQKNIKGSEKILMGLETKRNLTDIIEQVSNHDCAWCIIIGYKNWDDISTSHFSWKG